MRDHVLLFINGCKQRVSGSDVFLSLADFLRYRLGLVGTKVVCSEGDCGACTVLVGRPRSDVLEYQSVDSCIQFLFQLDGRHVVTVEGLLSGGRLHPVQEALIRCHGSQCGFCTPGIVMAMAGMLEQTDRMDELDLRYGLTGNLCRCTGYSPIIEAGLKCSADALRRMNEQYPPAPILADFAASESAAITVASEQSERRRIFYSPDDLPSALEFLAEHPRATIVAGGTDLGVLINKGVIAPDVILDLNRVAELEGVSVDGGVLVAGARASWTEIERSVELLAPPLHHILTLFGAPQIRNVGTIGGNIANASPIADSLPFLFVCEAELELRSLAGVRYVNINDFYQSYKQIDLLPGELLVRVRIPLPSDDSILRLYKVSRRRDLDIAGFTAAILVRLEGPKIKTASVSLGAVGPTVIRARRTEAFLVGRPFNELTMREAGEVAVGEISPISDVRGSQDFRRCLTQNVFTKFFHETNSHAVDR